MFFRGCVYWCDFSKLHIGEDSFYRGVRPVIVVSNDIGNYHSSMVTVVPCSSRVRSRFLPTHFCFKIFSDILSYAHCENVLTIPKSFCQVEPLYFLSDVELGDLKSCLDCALGLVGDED